MRTHFILLTVTILFLFASCGLSSFDEKGKASLPDGIHISEDSNLFTTDNSNTNLYVFETNDRSFLNSNGYTFWTSNTTNTSATFETITVRLTKVSGRIEAGYGIVFCNQQINGTPYMLSVLISANGLYAIGKITNGVFYHLEDTWKTSNYINKGYGIKNKICVCYDNNENCFLLRINDMDVTTFTVPEDIVFSNSKSGFVVVIAGNEEFPEKPVRVEFEK